MCTIKYSIVIPHYNTPDLLRRCLKSIPHKEYIQIIVVDDNSPGNENYPYLIPELNRCEFYITTEKKGAGHVRNVAMKYIRGEKVIFADADDLFIKDVGVILDEYYYDDSDIIFFNTIGAFSDNLNKKSNRNKNSLFLEYYRTGNEDIFRYKYTEPWGKIYSYKNIKDNDVKFDETIVANDQMFSVKTGIFAKKIKIVNKPIYIVTVRENSLSYKAIDTKEKLITRIHVTARVQVFLHHYGYCTDEMMVYGYVVNLLRRFPLSFVKELIWLNHVNIDVTKLLWMIIRDKIFSPSKWNLMNNNTVSYE